MKTLEEYMKLDYAVEVNELPRQYGGGYVASIPLLASASASGWGETPAKAVSALEKNKGAVIARLLEEGKDIPEPCDDGFGCDILISLPAPLHRKIAAIADGEGKELEACIIGLITDALMTPR